MYKLTMLIVVSNLIIYPIVYAEDKLVVGNFSNDDLSGWTDKVFNGETKYTIANYAGKKVLKAVSNNSASGLFIEKKIDIQKHPFINWSWRTQTRLPPGNELAKEGDDYVARVYVVISGGLLFWDTKAINYVWSSSAEKGSSWPNAFAGSSAQMLAVRSDEDDVNTWYYEKRNVYEDLKSLFGKSFQYIDGVAVMTDTDNSKSNAISYYGDIFFSVE